MLGQISNFFCTINNYNNRPGHINEKKIKKMKTKIDRLQENVLEIASAITFSYDRIFIHFLCNFLFLCAQVNRTCRKEDKKRNQLIAHIKRERQKVGDLSFFSSSFPTFVEGKGKKNALHKRNKD